MFVQEMLCFVVFFDDGKMDMFLDYMKAMPVMPAGGDCIIDIAVHAQPRDLLSSFGGF